MSIHLYVEDVDAFFARALAAGARERKPVVDQFYGDRSGELEDPFGHLWWVATHREDVPPDEMQRRVQAMNDPRIAATRADAMSPKLHGLVTSATHAQPTVSGGARSFGVGVRHVVAGALAAVVRPPV